MANPVQKVTTYQLLTAGLEREQALAYLHGDGVQDGVRARGSIVDAPGAVSATNIGKEPLSCILRVSGSPSIDEGAVGFVSGPLAWNLSGGIYRLRLMFTEPGLGGGAMACWYDTPPANVGPMVVNGVDSIYVYFHLVSTGALIADPRSYNAALNVWAMRVP
jgi:hypothetical protein